MTARETQESPLLFSGAVIGSRRIVVHKSLNISHSMGFPENSGSFIGGKLQQPTTEAAEEAPTRATCLLAERFNDECERSCCIINSLIYPYSSNNHLQPFAETRR